VVGVLGGIIGALLIVVAGGAYYMHQRSGKQVEFDDNIEMMHDEESLQQTGGGEIRVSSTRV
jgi:hypothetical protein